MDWCAVVLPFDVRIDRMPTLIPLLLLIRRRDPHYRATTAAVASFMTNMDAVTVGGAAMMRAGATVIRIAVFLVSPCHPLHP